MLANNDGNFRRTKQGNQDIGDDEVQSEPETEDLLEDPPFKQVETTEGSSPAQSQRRSTQTPRPAVQTDNMPSPRTRPFTGMPPGISPQVISSSENSQYAVHRRPGNTVVRRKNLSGHSVIAEATKATGSVMAAQMQEIASANREMERFKLEVQLKRFSKQMEYQKEKDRRVYENAVAANENARLAILKQSEMVHCLVQLSSVLSTGLTMSSGKTSGVSTDAGYHQYSGARAPLYPGQPSNRHFGGTTFYTTGNAPSDTTPHSTTREDSVLATRALASEGDPTPDKPLDSTSTHAQ